MGLNTDAGRWEIWFPVKCSLLRVFSPVNAREWTKLMLLFLRSNSANFFKVWKVLRGSSVSKLSFRNNRSKLSGPSNVLESTWVILLWARIKYCSALSPANVPAARLGMLLLANSRYDSLSMPLKVPGGTLVTSVSRKASRETDLRAENVSIRSGGTGNQRNPTLVAFDGIALQSLSSDDFW